MDNNNKNKENKSPQTFSGKVVSNKMKDTVVVAVERFVKHPKYQKYFTVTKRYKADDKGNTRKVGERVVIEACRPISKDKHFKVLTSEPGERL